ncbi:spore gernimation protein GerC [Bacillus sp. FJAT-22090]|uniref:Ger(x)C family spore germination protein n=1 Tax=Bacillus sp. FJAT-22090 TaxID=1581038 RepID=UPI0006AF9EDD|nr:Ger(x)C family spore germination protein [Bacillus sp. FJAT-22090]ALC85625.1 spore gernimation protein GerC [Bacillus sp. FJAT-22090]
MNKCLIVLSLLSLMLTGCWDKRELNELALVMGLGIDKIDDEYLASIQVVLPGEVSPIKGGTGRSPVTLFIAKGKTINEAIRNVTSISPRTLYIGHLQMVIIGEELAQEGIGSLLDYLSRYWEARSDFYLAIAKDSTAEKILNVQTTLENIPANNFFHILKTSEESLSSTTAMTLAKLIIDLEREGKEGVLTGIKLLGDEKSGSSKQNVETILPSAYLKLEEIAVFNHDKLVGWLSPEEGKGYNSITNHVKNTIGILSCPDEGTLNVHGITSKTKLKSKMANGKPEIEVSVHLTGNVGEVDCQIDLNKEETFKKLNKLYEEEIKKNINDTVKFVQEDLGSDIFGFGAKIHQDHPEEWKKLKKNWDEEFKEVPVNIKVKVEIRHTGSVINPILKTIKD